MIGSASWIHFAMVTCIYYVPSDFIPTNPTHTWRRLTNKPNMHVCDVWEEIRDLHADRRQLWPLRRPNFQAWNCNLPLSHGSSKFLWNRCDISRSLLKWHYEISILKRTHVRADCFVNASSFRLLSAPKQTLRLMLVFSYDRSKVMTESETVFAIMKGPPVPLGKTHDWICIIILLSANCSLRNCTRWASGTIKK